MIEDYQRGGNLLIDKYVEAKEQEYAARKVEKDKVRGGLRKVFQDAKEELTIRMAKFKENAANLKSDLERRERRDNAAVEKLMAIANG
jgi:sugar-specific transcriptional regulator TrmB